VKSKEAYSKINFYFRAPNPINFSIENLFNTYIKELESDYNCKSVFTKNQFDWRALFKRYEADVHHITGAVNYISLSLPGRKTILTVHDVGFYENPVNRGLKKWIYGWLWFRIPLKKVRFITVVSEFTKERLNQNFKIASEKIHVIPNPVFPHFIKSPKVKGNDIFKVLQIGTGNHKNLNGLIHAVKNLEVELIIIGKPSKEDYRLLRQNAIKFSTHHKISTRELVERYKESDILFFASHYEGFGMPIIEAQSVGRPVITSNFGAMKEVAADSAYLVDPKKPESIKEAIVALKNDRILYDKFVDKGYQNAKRFSLQQIIDRYKLLYEKILQEY